MMRERLLLSAIALATAAVAAACEREPADEPTREAAETSEQPRASSRADGEPDAHRRGPDARRSERSDARLLATDVVAGKICAELEGSLLGLARSEGVPERGDERRSKAGIVAARPERGRLLIESCRARRTARGVALDVAGRGFQFVSKRSSTAGADFELHQYVRFRGEVRTQGTVDVGYDPRRRIATVWLTPSTPVDATIQPIGDVDVDAEGLWSEVVGGVGRIFGQSPDRRAEQRIEERGSKRFEAQLSDGLSLAIDLCSGQKHFTVGALRRGETPEPAIPLAEHVHLANATVELYADGIDADGPFEPEGAPVHARVIVDQGPGVEATLACEDDALGAIDAFIDDGRVAPPRPRARATVATGESETLRTRARCPLFLFVRPRGETMTKYRYVVWREGQERRPIAPCPGRGGSR